MMKRRVCSLHHHYSQVVIRFSYMPTLDTVHFIDYEYGTLSYRGFDIANHFNEHAGFDCDYSLYPSKSFQQKWLRIYLESYTRGCIIIDADVERLYQEVEKFSLASHFFWAVWALVQAEISDLEFDYLEYALLRLGEMRRRWEVVLG